MKNIRKLVPLLKEIKAKWVRWDIKITIDFKELALLSSLSFLGVKQPTHFQGVLRKKKYFKEEDKTKKKTVCIL